MITKFPYPYTTGEYIAVVYWIRILESNPASYFNFLDLDCISFSFQPDSDPVHPNEKNLAVQKSWYGIIVVWRNITIFRNHVLKIYLSDSSN